MIHRQNNVLLTDSDGNPDFAASYTVSVCPVGAVAAANSSGSTATVDTGHGVRAADKILIWDGTTATFVAEAVNSVTATTIVWSSATPSISSGDLLVNLGPDTASGATPAYDGFSGEEFIFSDADGATQISNNLVTCNSTGNYDYYTMGDGKQWELIRDSGGTVASVVDGWGGVPGRFNICDYGAIGDNSTDNAGRINAAILAANGGTIWIPGGPNANYRCNSKISLNANDKLLGDPDATLLKNFTSADANVGSAFIDNASIATASDDNIEIGGFRIDLAVSTYAGDIIQLWSDNGYIHDLRIVDFGATGGVGGRAIIARGDNYRISRVHATSDLDESGNGGIIWCAGTGCVVSDCIVRAGDDAFGCNIWTDGDWADLSAAEYTLSNCRAESNNARMFFCGAGTGAAVTASITDVTVNGLTGFGEKGLVHIHIGNASSTGTISRVSISNVVGDGTKNDEQEISIKVQDASGANNISDVVIEGCVFPVSAHASAITAPVLFNSTARTIFKNNIIDATGQTAAQLYVVLCQDCTEADVVGNIIRLSTTDPTGATYGAIQYGNGTDAVTNGHICNNTILDVQNGLGSLSSAGAAIRIIEATSIVCNGNVIRLGSGNSDSIAILDGGGTAEGNNIIMGNNLIDFIGETTPIDTLDEGDTCYIGNVGFNPVGYEAYTADSTPAQGDVPVRAAFCDVTVGAEDRSITLPSAIRGRQLTILNNSGSTDLQIYPASGDQIDTDSVDDPKFLAGVGTATLYARNDTQWITIAGTLKSLS